MNFENVANISLFFQHVEKCAEHVTVPPTKYPNNVKRLVLSCQACSISIIVSIFTIIQEASFFQAFVRPSVFSS